MQIEIPTFEHLPERLNRLGVLAYNLWWCWNTDARRMFRFLDRALWEKTGNNPVKLLQNASPERLAAAATDPAFVKLYDSVVDRFDNYHRRTDTWFQQHYPERSRDLVAYLCAEFAVHTSVPIYSGGLGLLAGDTCKEASDMGIPFVAVGALYPEGYFRQRLVADGSQEALYERLRIEETALLPVLDDDGSRLLVDVLLDNRHVRVALWRLQVGRVPIYLMDTDIPENEPWDRDMVARLYVGDIEVRLRQEIVLGIGGIRVLRRLGYNPTVVHLNEGHAAFAALELIRQERSEGKSLAEALEATNKRLVFTTHTPVEAGHDAFPHHLIEQHLGRYWEDLGMSREELLGLGSAPNQGTFSMTILALRTAGRVNAVSRRHGEVSRAMWHFLFPDRPVEQVPIISVTNGVHLPTWLAGTMVRLFSRYLPENWWERQDDPAIWEAVMRIPDEELWNAHLTLKGKLFNFMRSRARSSWMSQALSSGQLVAHGLLMNQEALTIGFARRFATYKRANLILRDTERLKRLLLDPWRPVQIVFAGKPHPADEPGKLLLREVYEACASPQFGGRIAFIDNYDKQVAHHLVAGVDVWLNNPEPPKEASGTSGQKAALNGALNFSVLDGWWCEGYNGKNGWAIEGHDEDSTARSIYELLENEIVPCFYSRDTAGIPRQWLERMKESIRSIAPNFSTRRMLREYLSEMYFPTS
ncbi:MAG TPA: alpha-glucan family phosphorylase [Acidobacteriota bacterium]|nr:alpha-glucan family phosphorylase [Acidobacteriota bacterium]